MADYTITLTAMEDTAMTMTLERLNAVQPEGAPVLTGQDLCERAVRNELRTALHDLDIHVGPLVQAVKGLPAGIITAIENRLPPRQLERFRQLMQEP